MRGEDERSEDLFSFVRLEQRVPADHPLRAIRALVDEALGQLSRSFARLYARDGRPSIPPERLLRALLLQAFFTVRSERQLMEQLDYNLLFRWFVGLSMDEAVWDATVFCKNRDRLFDGDIARKIMARALRQAQGRPGKPGCRRKELRPRRLRRRRPQAGMHAAGRAEHDQPPFGDRWPHHASCRLCHQHDQTQAHRGALRLDEDCRHDAQDPSSRAAPRRVVLRSHCRRLQRYPHPKASGSDGMNLSGETMMTAKPAEQRALAALPQPSSSLASGQPSEKSAQKSRFSATC